MMRWLFLLLAVSAFAAEEGKEKAGIGKKTYERPEKADEAAYDENVKEEIEDSHDADYREEEVMDQVHEDEDEHEQHAFMNFPPFFHPMYLPPWMQFFGPGGFNPFMPAPQPQPERYLKAMQPSNELGLMDVHSIEDGNELAEALAETQAHVMAEAYAEAHDYAEAMAHQRAERRRRNAIDTIEVQHPDEFWYDIDGGQVNEVSELLNVRTTGYNAYKKILEKLNLYSFPLHLGEIGTGNLPHPELSPASDRAFGKKFDFHASDLESFRYAPKGRRFSDIQDFMEYFKSGYLPKGGLFVIHKVAILPKSKCWVRDGAVKSGWDPCSCEYLHTPGVYQLVDARKWGKRTILIFKEAYAGGKYWGLLNINMMGVQENSPVLEKMYMDH